MASLIWRRVRKWLLSLLDKIAENPVRNLFILLLSIFFILVLGWALMESFGVITFIGYLMICLFGLTKIIDSPQRAFYWFAGSILGAISILLAIDLFLPTLQKRDAASIVSLMVIIAIIGYLFIKSTQFKKM